MSSLGLRELLVLLLIVIILFGAKRLPDTARSLGRSLRILKTEVKGDPEENGKGTGSDGSAV